MSTAKYYTECSTCTRKIQTRSNNTDGDFVYVTERTSLFAAIETSECEVWICSLHIHSTPSLRNWLICDSQDWFPQEMVYLWINPHSQVSCPHLLIFHEWERRMFVNLIFFQVTSSHHCHFFSSLNSMWSSTESRLINVDLRFPINGLSGWRILGIEIHISGSCQV